MEYMVEMTAVFNDMENDLGEINSILESVTFITKNSKDLPWVTEATKENSVKNKIVSVVKKIKNLIKKVIDFFNGKVFKKAEERTKDANMKSKKASVKGVDPKKKKEQLDKQYKKIMEAKNKFMNMRGYNKAVVPVSYILGWVPPFTPIPGASELLIAFSSIGDFILDYKRAFCGEQSRAIQDFNDWIEKNIEKLDESDIYASDKILSRMAGFIGEVIGEVKRLCLVCADKSFDAAKVVNKGLDKGTNIIKNKEVKEKLKKNIKKSNDTLNEVSNDSKETLQKYKEFKNKKKEKKSNKSTIAESVNILADMDLFEIGD